MIAFVKPEEVLPLRSRVLRDGGPLEVCSFDTDTVDGAFHLGCSLDGELVGIASFFPEAHEKFQGLGYRLRGMATAPEVQGKGYGNQLLNFGIVYLRGQKANYIWCNARKAAVRFYKSIGFELISDEFDIPGIGAHYVMYLKIQ